MTSCAVLLLTNNFRILWESTYFKVIFFLISSVPARRQGGSGDLPANSEQRQGVVRGPRRVPRNPRRLQEVVEGKELSRTRRTRPAYHRVPLRQRGRAQAQLRRPASPEAPAQLAATDLRLAAAGGAGW